MSASNGLNRLIRHTRAWSVWRRYLVTLLLVAAALGVRIASDPVFGDSYPFLLFLVPILLAACLFDHGSGLVATAVAALAAALLYLSPTGSLRIEKPADQAALVAFMAIGAAMSGVVEAMHRALAQVQQALAQLDRSERRRRLLLHEFRHRTRNDLQSLSALLLLRARAATSAAAGEGLREAAGHARTLARVHGWLARGVPGDGVNDPGQIDTGDFVEGLCHDLEITIAAGGLRPIALRASAEHHMIDTERAVHLGLVLNELVTNAIKYGFPDERHGTVCVRFRREAADFLLTVADDGVGAPTLETEAERTEFRNDGAGLGTRLMRGLAAQLRGRFERLANPEGSGTLALLRFPVAEPGAPAPAAAQVTLPTDI